MASTGKAEPGIPATRYPMGRTAKPEGTRVVIDSTPTRLDIDVPPLWLSGRARGLAKTALQYVALLTGMTVVLCVVCTAGPRAKGHLDPVEVVWMALTGGLLLGGCVVLVLLAASSALMKQRLEIGGGSFRASKQISMLEGRAPTWLVRLLGGGREWKGSSSHLLGAFVTPWSDNIDTPMVMEVVDGADISGFGGWLHPVERDWVAGEINAWLAENRDVEVHVGAAPPATLGPKDPKLIRNDDQPPIDNCINNDCETDPLLHNPPPRITPA